MEAKLSERKRKEPPSRLLGTFTRSKSQIYTHYTRSGRLRSSDPVLTPCNYRCRHPNAEADVSRAPRRRPKSSSPIAGEYEREVAVSATSIKDLRSRRVFSEPLVVREQEEKNPVLSVSVEGLKFAGINSLKEKSLCNGDDVNGVGEELSWSRPAVEAEKADTGVNCTDGGVHSENPNFSTSAGMCSEDKGGKFKAFGQGGERSGFQKVDSACNDQQLDDFGSTLFNFDEKVHEENVQATPPDPDIFSIQKDDEYRLNGAKNVVQAENNCTMMRPAGSPSKNIDSTPRRKLVLNPTARLKVFKTPSSVSYRRLLPYLLDIAKDKSSLMEINSSRKNVTFLDEKPTVQPQVSSNHNSHFNSRFEDKTLKPMLHTVSEEMTEDDFIEKFPANMQPGDCTNQISSDPTLNNCSSDATRPIAVTTDGQNEIPSPSKTPRGNSSHVDLVWSAKRLKVFKSPSSISYRRLLPYLLDITKERSCALEIKSCPTVEIVLEKKPSTQFQDPLAHPNHISASESGEQMSKSVMHTAAQEMSKDGSKENFPFKMQAGDSTDQVLLNSATIDCPSTAVYTDIQNGMCSPSNSPKEDLSHVDRLSSAKSGEINISPALVLDPSVSFTDSTPPSKLLQGCTDVDHTTSITACEDTDTLYQSMSPCKALPSSEPPTVSPTKGILKRNPRGCRGLCTCLNCASFRLHAERAFEFSRNQFQDTEEIVLELMKELSQVRTALEMSVDDSISQASSNIDQVKKVCTSASRAEEIAKTRLKELSEDLFAHCRIKCLQRPRVNFAAKMEEKCFGREKPI